MNKWEIREKRIHKIETHVAGICIREDGTGNFKILIGKRTSTRELFPSYWECGGGQVHEGENFEEAIKYHMKEEFNIDIEVVCPILTYEIRLRNKVIPGLRFICKLKNKEQVPTPNPLEFVECKWIQENEIEKYKFIPGLKDDLKRAIKLYKAIRPALEIMRKK